MNDGKVDIDRGVVSAIRALVIAGLGVLGLVAVGLAARVAEAMARGGMN